MSTLSEQFAREEEARKAKKKAEAAKKKPKRKTKAKRDEHGRFVKAEDTADLSTPSF